MLASAHTSSCSCDGDRTHANTHACTHACTYTEARTHAHRSSPAQRQVHCTPARMRRDANAHLQLITHGGARAVRTSERASPKHTRCRWRERRGHRGRRHFRRWRRGRRSRRNRRRRRGGRYTRWGEPTAAQAAVRANCAFHSEYSCRPRRGRSAAQCTERSAIRSGPTVEVLRIPKRARVRHSKASRSAVVLHE